MKFIFICALVCGSFFIPAASASEPLRGELQFRTHCARCHSMGCNQVGPKLEGVFGRKAGGVTDFENYSPAMRASEVVWTEKTMDAFLYDPEKSYQERLWRRQFSLRKQRIDKTLSHTFVAKISEMTRVPSRNMLPTLRRQMRRCS